MQKTARLVYTDDGGKTRFGETTIDFGDVADAAPGGVFQAAGLGTSDAALVEFAPGFVSEFHHTPSPTWMFMMAGQMELEVADGDKVVLVAGDIVRYEDADGSGHKSQVVGDVAMLAATAGFSS